jgi:hypothetical protein
MIPSVRKALNIEIQGLICHEVRKVTLLQKSVNLCQTTRRYVPEGSGLIYWMYHSFRNLFIILLLFKCLIFPFYLLLCTHTWNKRISTHTHTNARLWSPEFNARTFLPPDSISLAYWQRHLTNEQGGWDLQECNKKTRRCKFTLTYTLPLYTHMHTLRLGGSGTPLCCKHTTEKSFYSKFRRIGATVMNRRRERESELVRRSR